MEVTMARISEPVLIDDTRVCGRCGKLMPRSEMSYSYDCHGIPFRLVCPDCKEEIQDIGYDGEYYTEYDEQIEDDY
jgi:hypothetical protein